MTDVNEVFITKEVSEQLDLSSSYLIRLAKKLQNEGFITDKDMRLSGKRNYIFNKKAVEVIKNSISK
ncbi:AraC family transcriptional regulator [Clostridium botulinum]|uniref:AraC family transcriptional regulator n=1 Tax=Clostridium TaxID=1485 RepID=UPI0019673DD1|nr:MULTISPECIES: AraC family transcriptional regulator [Clostridium]MBN1075978.1 AraC family transcriptional regulator [Clostridium botulinum]